MAKYINVEDAIEAAINGCASWDGGYFPSMDEPIKDEFASIEDKCIDIVRCGECKWFYPEVICESKNYGSCKLPLSHINTHCMIPEDYFCADGERKDGIK